MSSKNDAIDNIIDKLSNTSIQNIIMWMVNNLSLTDIQKCLREYNVDFPDLQEAAEKIVEEDEVASSMSQSTTGTPPPLTYDEDNLGVDITPRSSRTALSPFKVESPVSLKQGDYPKRDFFNWVYPPESLEDIMMFSIRISINKRVVPLMILPWLTSKTLKRYKKNVENQQYLPYTFICYVNSNRRDKSKGNKILTEFTFYEFLKHSYVHHDKIDGKAPSPKYHNPYDFIPDRLDSKEILEMIDKKMNTSTVNYKFFFQSKDHAIEITKLNDKDLIFKTLYRYVLPFGYGKAYKSGFQYMYKYIVENKYGINYESIEKQLLNTPCRLIGFDLNQQEYLYSLENDMDSIKDVNELIKNCNSKELKKLKRENDEEYKNIISTYTIPEHIIYNTVTNPDILRKVDRRKIFQSRKLKYYPDESRIGRFDPLKDESSHSLYIPGSLNPDTVDGKIIHDRLEQYQNIDECLQKHKQATQEFYNTRVDCSNFGLKRRMMKDFNKVQRRAAQNNIYLTGYRFGTSKFLAYIFDEKNKKWRQDRKNKPLGQWKSLESLDELIQQKEMNKHKYGVTKQGMKNFMKFKDVKLDPKKFKFKQDFQLLPLSPNSFGYMNMGTVDRMGMQLYPLGRNAYFQGKHQGVSSNFSEQFSKRHGLWNPRQNEQYNNIYTASKRQNRIRRNHGKSPQFQFGQRQRRVEPNEYGPTFNSYLKKYQMGIPKSQYGYKGTQSAYAGYTGAVGHPGLSYQTVRQGLV